MTKQELDSVFALPTVAIIAPAGHGKTEMIVDMVEYANGRQLLLTHTNAGVDALQKRLNSRNISKAKYVISTIAAFCIRWGMSFIHTAAIDISLSPYSSKSETQRYYEQFYNGAKQIFEHDWAGRIMQSSYSGIIVDEYQDCLQIHHEMFKKLSRHLPIRVLGDPLQGIFSFGGQELVDWNTVGYQIVDIATAPWRWQNSNPALGNYLSDVREILLPTLKGQVCSLSIDSCNGSVCVVSPQAFNVFSMLKEFRNYQTVLYLTKWESQQSNFCMRSPGIFQVDEKQDCEELFQFARSFSDTTGANLIIEIIDFESKCATKIKAELKSYIDRLKKNSFDFSRISKNQEFGKLVTDVQNCDKYEAILQMLAWFEKKKTFRYYRSELHREMIRSIRYARDNNVTIFEAAEHIRKDPMLQKRYADINRLASRTLLSKGLEFDCVIINMETPLTAKEFYVAMTRAMKKIYILSSSTVLELSP